jgi:hypothetical protein
MRIGYRGLLAATFTLTALVSWGALSARQTVQVGPVDRLTRASACATSAYHVTAGDNATISVENDGGWCWTDTYERNYWRILSAYYATVTNPPKHGHVLVGDTANHEVRVAYQPNPGFAGTDSFIVHYEVNEHEQTYLVTVSR